MQQTNDEQTQVGNITIAIPVTNLQRSREFYNILWDAVPDQQTSQSMTYSQPIQRPSANEDRGLISRRRIVLYEIPSSSFQPSATYGFRLSEKKEVESLTHRLESAGINVQTQQCTHCGYHEQYKVHVKDPDGHYWHFFAISNEITPAQIHRCLEGREAKTRLNQGVSTFELSLNSGGNDPIPADLDLVTVTFPASVESSAARISCSQLETIFHSLQDWGSIVVEGSNHEIAADLRAIGFRGVEHGSGRTIGFRPSSIKESPLRVVIYKGPFKEVVDENGQTYRRGERVVVQEQTWNTLRQSSLYSQFLFLYPHDVQEKRPDLVHLVPGE